MNNMALGGGNFFYILITVGAMLVSRWVGGMLQKRFAEYSMRPIPLSGAQVAEKRLRDNGITDVQVISTPGQLTDHYNPIKKTVNLSEGVFHQQNVAAAAVAAHECGHAVQHAKSYAALKLRSALVPVVNLSSKYMNWVLLAGLFLAASGNTTVLFIGVILFATTTLFSIITLPVLVYANSSVGYRRRCAPSWCRHRTPPVGRSPGWTNRKRSPGWITKRQKTLSSGRR